MIKFDSPVDCRLAPVSWGQHIYFCPCGQKCKRVPLSHIYNIQQNLAGESLKIRKHPVRMWIDFDLIRYH